MRQVGVVTTPPPLFNEFNQPHHGDELLCDQESFQLIDFSYIILQTHTHSPVNLCYHH